MEVLIAFGNWLARYMSYISMAVVATLIFIYGEDINRFVKRHIKRKNFLVRLCVFVLVCAFGFGVATVLGVSLLSRVLLRLERWMLGPVVVLVFMVIGFLAERKKHM